MSEMTGTLAGESPLVPNRILLRMYAGMVESRLLASLIQDRRGKSKASNLEGEEACRASVLVDLLPEDFVSDVHGSVASALLRGAELRSIVTAYASKHVDRRAVEREVAGLLPSGKDSGDRLQLALGVALALRRSKDQANARSNAQGVVVFLAEVDAIKSSRWREALRFAADEELPMLFVALAARTAERAFKPFELSKRATTLGVPGVPVEATDAIALYRVAQESIGRARAGGGPALMECMPFLLPDQKAKRYDAPDPIQAFGETLLERGVCDEGWLTGVASAFRLRLGEV